MRILIVKLSSLGDVVHAMPAVQDIRRALPHAQIDWVVERGFAPLVARCEGVQRIIPTDLRRWRRQPFSAATRQAWSAFRADLRAQAYDAVIDLQGLSKSALVAWMARLAPGGQRHALANRTAGSSYEAPTRWVAHHTVHIPPRISAVDRSRVLCAHALDYVPEGPEHFGLRVQAAVNAIEAALDPAAGAAFGAASGFASGAASPRPQVALVHGTSRDDKLWPQEHWIDLARRLVDQGLGIGLPHGSDAEQARAQALARAIGPHAQVWPRLDLGALTDRLAACQGVIGVDSGLSHIATALDLPHVQIYNFDTAWRTGPVGRDRQLSVFGLPTPAVDAVWTAWQRALAASEERAKDPA